MDQSQLKSYREQKNDDRACAPYQDLLKPFKASIDPGVSFSANGLVGAQA
jgi:hypothetical protein